MKITSIQKDFTFGEQARIQNDEKKSKQNKNEKKYVDPLGTFPLRALGYTNDIGVAINEIAPTAARLFWVPALMYFGADVYDKYKNKGNEYDPNAKRAFTQATFQAFASIIFPTAFGHLGQSVFSRLEAFKGDKITTNAKEQTLRFINTHAAEHNVFEHLDNQEELMNQFEKGFNNFYNDKSFRYKKHNILVRMFDRIFANSKRGAIAISKEENIKAYARKQYQEILNTCKDSFEMKSHLDKRIFKLKAWKSLGAFAALIVSVKAIDEFVEQIIIEKFVKPGLKKVNFPHTKKMDEFIQAKQETPAKTAVKASPAASTQVQNVQKQIAQA